MRVYKFGGTSVGNPERIIEVGRLISGEEPKIVVFSAMSGTTNDLVQYAESLYNKEKIRARDLLTQLRNKYELVVDELFKTSEFKSKGKDLIEGHFNYLAEFNKDLFTIHEEKAVLAQGELISSALMYYHLQERGIPCALLPALSFMRIDKDAEPDTFYIKENLNRELEKYPDTTLFITQGFICRNAFGEIDNLKRGGSDYTASIIGATIHSEEVQIWTDIDGVHNNDPRYVEKTKRIDRLSFQEAAELAYFGAKILHPTSMRPAQDNNIPVRLKNTLDPQSPGTLITADMSGGGIKAIAAKDGITVIRIKSGRMLLAYGFLRKVFEVFENHKTPIDMITTSEVSVSVTMDDTTHLDDVLRDLNQFGRVDIAGDQTIICVVGDLLAETRGMASKILQSLSSIPVRMISYGSSNNNLSLLIRTPDKVEALNLLSQHLFPES